MPTRILVPALLAICSLYAADPVPATPTPAPAAGTAASAPATTLHRVVFQVQADGEERWNDALNNLDNLVATFGVEHLRIEVVTHGAGAGLVLARPGPLAERIARLQGQGVAFDVCGRTCAKRNLGQKDLLPNITIIDSGVAHVVRRQEEGWAYLKGGG